MSLYPFQQQGVEWLINHFRALLADEMGLGKTVQVVELTNRCPGIQKVLIVCPASLKINWGREFSAWGRRGLSLEVVCGTTPKPSNADVIIINYDILNSQVGWLKGVKWDLVVADEAHMLKNTETLRGEAFFSNLLRANRLLFLTGSPIMNRPAEIWSLLYAIDPKLPGSYAEFTERYCGGHHEDGRGWVAMGAQNLGELNQKLGPVMLRRLKKNVLKDLPAKTREVIQLGDTSPSTRNWKEKLANIRDEGDITVDLAEALSAQRREDGLAKLPFVVSHVSMLLEAGQKVILFAWHRDVVLALRERLSPNCPIITGWVSAKEKQEAHDRFQRDPECRLIIGNIQAMGVGWTLTASSLVVFAELDWVPFSLIQGEDRAHRIGQKDNVHVQYLVAGGTIDSRMGPSLVRKMNQIDHAVDGITPEVQAPEFNWLEEVKEFFLGG